jgi:hypothetical protein
MLTPQASAGLCELHGHYSADVKLSTIPHDKIPNLVPLGVTEESVLGNPLVICKKCRVMLKNIAGVNPGSPPPIEETMPPDLLNKADPLYPLLERLLSFKDIFPDLIDDIYLVPPEEVKGTRYAEKTFNVVIGFKAFSIQQYTAWAVKNRRSAAHLWNDAGGRSKFWGTRTLRLLLALSKIHLSSTQINLWVASYTRIVSMEFFCSSPPKMVQISPAKLYKVK